MYHDQSGTSLYWSNIYVYLKFKFNWVSDILSGTLTPTGKYRLCYTISNFIDNSCIPIWITITMKTEKDLLIHPPSHRNKQILLPNSFQCYSLQHILLSTCCHLYIYEFLSEGKLHEKVCSVPYPQCLVWCLPHRAYLINVFKKSNKRIWKVLTTVVLAIQHLLRREMCTFFLPLIEAEKMLRWPSVPEAVN